jgi:hypothetical protein
MRIIYNTSDFIKAIKELIDSEEQETE